jgi:hypothetical protein
MNLSGDGRRLQTCGGLAAQLFDSTLRTFLPEEMRQVTNVVSESIMSICCNMLCLIYVYIFCTILLCFNNEKDILTTHDAMG